MWPMLMFDSLRRFQQAQGVMWPIVAAVGITATINAIANYLVVYQFKMGFAGVSPKFFNHIDCDCFYSKRQQLQTSSICIQIVN
jgi:hypothetical protein